VTFIQVLDEVKILPNVKRFAGTSVGSIVAALLAMECTVSDIKKYLKINFDYLLKGNIY
jgi:predicted acylesterase/phospholipase RssA